VLQRPIPAGVVPIGEKFRITICEIGSTEEGVSALLAME
jgi:hypothetical protein